MDLDNWIIQLRKGILELCILNLLNEKEYYGYNLVKKLVSIKKLEAREGSIYPLLSRLKEQNLVKTRLEESNEGPVRKYYSLTEEGREFTTLINEYYFCLNDEIMKLMQGDINEKLDK